MTLVEVVVGSSLLIVLSTSALIASISGAGAYESASLNSRVEANLQRGMDRVTRELMSCGWSMVGPLGLDDEYGSSFFTFQQAEGWVDDAIQWGPVCRLVLELDPGELDDGIDNNGNSIVDECVLVLIRNDGGANEQRTVICRNVCELFEGEEDNDEDDNGNQVTDEAGFNVHQDGDILTIRLAVTGASEKVGSVVRSMTTSLRLRN